MVTPQARIISPSLSSGSNNNANKDETMSDEDGAASDTSRHERAALSPSPEVDFSCPELDGDDSHSPPLTPGGTFSGRNSVSSSSHRSSGAGNTARQPPPLERDEREFTQTAAEVRRRRRSEVSAANAAANSSIPATASKSASVSTSASGSASPVPVDFDDYEFADTSNDNVGLKTAAEIAGEVLNGPPFVPDFHLEGLDQETASGMSNSEAAAELFDHRPLGTFPSRLDENLAFDAQDGGDVDVDMDDEDDTEYPMHSLAGKQVMPRIDFIHVKPSSNEDLWGDFLKSPENVDMDELEALLNEQEPAYE